MTLFVARRPIFDAKENIFAYDLAVQGPVNASGSYDEVQTEHLLAEVFLESGIDTIAQGHSVLLTVGRDLLLSGTLPLLPVDRVILELPTDAGVDAEICAACRDLASGGYRLALAATDPAPLEPVLPCAHLVRVDVAKIDAARLPEVVRPLGGRQVRLLAANVEHAAERDRCAALGFDLFEGYRFSIPENFTRREIGIEHLTAFRVLKLVRDPNAADQDIEELLQSDVGLSYKLLRMVNSASTGGRDIWSIGHALRLLGREQVARWLSVLLVTDGEAHGVRSELMHLALLRARMCEGLASLTKVKQARGPLFLIGMLSVLDQLLEIPMPALCDAMDLAPDLRNALLHRADFFGAALRLVEAYVGGAWAEVDELAPSLEVTPGQLQPLYLEAMAWATAHRRSDAA